MVKANVFALFLDGLPGAGKSSLADSITQHYRDMGVWKRVELIEEYICKPMLDVMTSNIQQYGFAYQVMMLQRRINTLNQIIELLRNKTSVIVDRSLVGDTSFAQNLYNEGIMSHSEWLVYKDMMQEAIVLQKKIKTVCDVSQYIYVNVTPEEALERIAKRKRSSESSYTFEYLSGLEDSHCKMYQNLEITPLRIEWKDQIPRII